MAGRIGSHERERTGIKSLKIGFNKVFGYYLKSPKATWCVMPQTTSVKTLVNAERFNYTGIKGMEVK